jgi:hypothetical protein
VTLRPLAGAPFGPVSVQGLRVAGTEVRVSVDADGRADVTGLPPGMSVVGTDRP